MPTATEVSVETATVNGDSVVAPSVGVPSGAPPSLEVPTIPPLSTTDKDNDKLNFTDFNPKEPAKQEPVVEKPTTEPTKEPAATEPVEHQTTTQQPDVAVDLSHIAPADLPMFKQMSNAAKARMAKLYKERDEFAKQVAELPNLQSQLEEARKQASGGLPPNYLQHPEAFRFSPAYKKAAETYQAANTELSFWKQQYGLITAGKDWTDYQPDGKGGLMPVTRQADADAQGYVLDNMQACRIELAKQQGIAEQIQQSHTNSYQRMQTAIAETTKRSFPAEFNDPKAYDTNEHMKTMKAALVEQGLWGNDMLADAFCKLYAVYMAERIKNVQAKQPPAPAVPASNAAKPNQPVSSQATGGLSGKGDMVSMADFESQLRR